MRRPKIDPGRIRELASPDLIREQARQDLKLPYRMLPINLIQPDPLQPRQTFDPAYIEELRSSIAENGLLQPVTVRKKDGMYLLVAGECRHRASKLAGLPEIPCILRDMDDRTASIIALVENVQRQDLNPIDLARHLRRIHDEFELTWEQVSQAVGKSAVRVKALAGLVELPDDLQEGIRQGRIAADTGRELARVDDPEERRELIERASAGSLPQAQARALVRESMVAKLKRHEKFLDDALAAQKANETPRETPTSSDLRLALQYADLLLNKLRKLTEEERGVEHLREKLDEIHAEIHRGL
jgi:ParB family chromosome partitioning protein